MLKLKTNSNLKLIKINRIISWNLKEIKYCNERIIIATEISK